MDPTRNIESCWNVYERRLQNNMSIIFELLQKHNLKATFFCLGWIGRNYPDIIKKIHLNGHEIANHSDMHQMAFQLNPEEFEKDLNNSNDILQDLTGQKIITYRAPAFSISESNKWALEILCDHGIEIDCSIFPTKRDYGGFENFKSAKPCIVQFGNKSILEFPINLYKIFGSSIIFSGGGYFRLLPLFALKKMFSQSKYTMTYFHPRDFDPDQPMMAELPAHRKFKSYYGLSTTLTKLDYILNKFEFIDLRTAKETLDISSLSTIRVQ